MKAVPISPFKAVDKAYYKIKPNRTEFNNFKAQLIRLIESINDRESEEHNKNLVSDFLKNTFYKDYYVNTKSRTDLAVYLGKTAQDKAGIIIEAKSPANKHDMVKKDNLNAKAMHEAILYYLQERIEEKNDEIKHIIITNAYEWFIFNANEFEKLFYKNKQLVDDYKKWKADKKVSSLTEHFYNEIAKKYIDEIDKEISFVYFDLRDYLKILKSTKSEDEKKLIPLFKIFSVTHLLKESFLNDSNQLNKQFYQELLYIIGLEETKDKNKKVIGRKLTGSRDGGALIENTIRMLENDDAAGSVESPERYGENKEERIFNIALELNITWINRILFLKLLEAQLVNYHGGDNKYKFLDTKTIEEYDDLYELFHEVLAKKIDDRSADVIEKFKNIPYLNSSLFEQSELEKKTIRISNLKDRSLLPIYKQSVLKNSAKKPPEKLHTLEYLLMFLDAFDFASDSAGDIQEENKNLINASVLGRIFEKINGYKEGSFFTPGFITMYMAKETLRRAVLQKFYDVKGWGCNSFDELKDKITDKKEANEIINSLKICDPAVGSGHFLVSALNELLAIKSDLDVLCYRDRTRVRYYKVEVANDELSVYDEEAGEFFEYTVNEKGIPPAEKQKLQEALFHEKETIIENCLFGVDINQNSVNICRLRLWIELLKNAYYNLTPGASTSSATGAMSSYKGEWHVPRLELVTLPNIDINIKQGNSLISRFDLSDDYSKMPMQVQQKMKLAVQKYKDQVFIYKNTSDKETRNKSLNEIKELKEYFSQIVNPTDKDYILLKKKETELGEIPLLFDRKEKEDYEKKVIKLEEEVKELRNKYDEKLKTIYGSAFEWRFEFPEVLDEEGRFVGFDVVIGNPPYGVDLKMNEKIEFKKKFKTIEGEFEIYTLFIELGLNSLLIKNGIISYITANTWYYLDKFSVLRKDILLNYSINTLIELEKLVFADAPDIVPVIFIIEKQSLNENIRLYKAQNTQRQYDLTYFDGFTKNIVSQNSFMKSDTFVFNLLLDNRKQNILKKIKLFPQLNENYKIVYGIKTGDNKSNLSKEIKLNGNWKKCTSSANNISKYNINWKGDYLNVGKHLPGLGKVNYEQPKILIQYIRKLSMPTRLVCALDEKGEFYPLNNFSFIISEDKYSLKFLLGILNSRMINWYYANTFIDYNIKPKYLEKIPINIDKSFQKDIETIVNKIISVKRRNQFSDTSSLEKEIDQMVYKLYGLTEEEIRIVENV